MGPVAVLDDYQAAAEACADWGELGRRIEFFGDHLADHDALVERLSPFEVIVVMRERTPFTPDLLATLPHLQLLVTTGMYNAAIDMEAASHHGVTVCGTGAPTHAAAELAFGLIHVLARNLIDEIESARSGGWQVTLGHDLRAKTLGLVGLGRLGERMARYGAAFGMDVVAWSTNLTEERAIDVGARRVSQRELFSSSDFVSIHLRLGERTRGLVGPEQLSWMKPTSYLINTSRAQIVEADALLAAVRQGTIAGAAVDVYDVEPPPYDHPLRHEPRIIPTPHIGYVTKETYDIFYREAAEDIAAWDAGSPIRVLAAPAGS